MNEQRTGPASADSLRLRNGNEDRAGIEGLPLPSGITGYSGIETRSGEELRKMVLDQALPSGDLGGDSSVVSGHSGVGTGSLRWKDSKVILRTLHHGIIYAVALVGFLWGLIAFYWVFFDRTPPVDFDEAAHGDLKGIHLGGTLVSYNSVARTAVMQWTAYKNRYCPGQRNGWIREAGNEPPPRATIPLSDVILPPEDFRGSPVPAGQVVTWKTIVAFSDGIPDAPFVYGAEWVFHCNPVRDVKVRSPLITVTK